jgi:hypothetical protein
LGDLNALIPYSRAARLLSAKPNKILPFQLIVYYHFTKFCKWSFFSFTFANKMQPTSAIMKNAIGLFFEGLMLLFIVVVCSFGYGSLKLEPFKNTSLHMSSVSELVMNEGVSNVLEQLSANSLNFEWEVAPFELLLIRSVKLSFKNLFVNASAHNVFYVFISSSAP